MDTPAAVFVVTMQAIAGPDHARPDGRRYDLLVFVRAADQPAAEGVARNGLARLGWIAARALRSGQITEPAAIPDDLVGSYDRAVRNGCAVIVYDEP